MILPSTTLKIQYVKKVTGADVATLPPEDIEKLCLFCLNATALEMPRFAERDARALGMKVTLRKD